MPEMEASLPPNDQIARARLHCGLGKWLQRARNSLPAAEREYREAIKLAPQFGLPHALLGDLLMGKSSNFYVGDQKDQSRRVHDEAKEELDKAIQIAPNDPTPYYAYCYSCWVDIAKLRTIYLQAVKLDKVHSVFYDDSHWEFAMKAAEHDGFMEASQDAFLRAMILNPSEYESGVMSTRPAGGMALYCWKNAKEMKKDYFQYKGKIDSLW